MANPLVRRVRSPLFGLFRGAHAKISLRRCRAAWSQRDEGVVLLTLDLPPIQRLRFAVEDKPSVQSRGLEPQQLVAVLLCDRPAWRDRLAPRVATLRATILSIVAGPTLLTPAANWLD